MDFDAGVDAVRAFLRREEERLARETGARVTALRALVPPAAAVLRAAGATSVWVFGSLAERAGWSAPHPESDLDLAVAGLDSTALLAAEQRLRALSDEAIDVVRVEDAPPSLRARILADGEHVP